MANPEYEAKVNPADLYNDEILDQFEAIRNVIHKEILPSTYNELIVTSNQAGVFNNPYKFNFYPSTELIFPLSPQSGNINWLEKNFLRFKLTINDYNASGYHLLDFPINENFFTQKSTNNVDNRSYYNDTILGIIDGASIFKSIELNYGGTAIWTSAYQQVESFFTFANIPDQLTSQSPQYLTSKKDEHEAISALSLNSSTIKYSGSAWTGTSTDGKGFGNTNTTTPQTYSILIDIDVSRISPILSWLSLIPGFINKLTLRVVLDCPLNYLVIKYRDTDYTKIQDYRNIKIKNQFYQRSGYRPLPKSGLQWYNGEILNVFSYDNITWTMDLCEIHQCNATMTEDTRIRLISLIQQMGGRWIYPCRYWNTTIAPIVSYNNATDSTNTIAVTHQFILTGCYFRSISFTTIPDMSTNIINHYSPGNGLFTIEDFSNLKIYCDSELIVSYTNSTECITDTDSALIDNDKYTISTDIIQSLKSSANTNGPLAVWRDCMNKALGPPNGLYSGKYTSEKMGTHNIIIQYTFPLEQQSNRTIQAWLGALIDGVVVFDGFNGNYFTTGRKMQQVYEALS